MVTTTNRPRSTPRARRWLCALFATLMLASIMTVGAFAQVPAAPQNSVETDVYLDGIEILDGDCVIWRDTTFVPLRKFCNLFDGCRFVWDAKTSTATVYTDSGMTLIIQSGALYIWANGHYFYTVEAVQNWGGSLYVPIRPLARAFNATLKWNNSLRAVELSSPTGTPAVAWANYDEDDLYWLARIISAEAQGEPLKGQIAVGNVVLNRVANPVFPNSVHGVLAQRNQFSTYKGGKLANRTPNESSVLAAKLVLDGGVVLAAVVFCFIIGLIFGLYPANKAAKMKPIDALHYGG